MRLKDTVQTVRGAFSGNPHIVSTPWLNTRPLWEGYPVVYDPVYRERTALDAEGSPPLIFVGFEEVELRWMKPDGKGGLIPK